MSATVFDISEFNRTDIVDYIENNFPNGADGYIIKLGENYKNDWLDDNFVINVNNVVKYNKPFGLYFVNHFEDENEARREAKWFNDTVFSYLGSDHKLFTMGCWADVEVPKALGRHTQECTFAFLDALQEMWFNKPLGVYTSYSTFLTYYDMNELAKRQTAIWVAQYNKINDLKIEYPNLNHRMWQYTDSYNGINLDGNIWY